MAKVALLTILCLFAGLVAGVPAEQRITNGHTAAVGQFPYQVGLFNKYDIITYWWCTGALIGANWVLTTTRCTQNTVSIILYLGTNKRRSGGLQIQIKSADSVIQHPNFNQYNQINDIALIRIPTVTFTDLIQPVALPAIADIDSTFAGDFATAAGWGYTTDKVKEYSPTLQWADFEIISNEECKSKLFNFSIYVYNSTICVATENGVSPCEGDLGAPLVLDNTGVLVGLRSIGPYGNYGYYGKWVGCEYNYPNMFTRVSSYLDWIKEHTGISY